MYPLCTRQNRVLKKKYQGEHEETERYGCSDKNTDADGSQHKVTMRYLKENERRKSAPYRMATDFFVISLGISEMYTSGPESTLEQPYLDSKIWFYQRS